MDSVQVRTTGRRGFVTIPRHLTEWDGLDAYDLRVGLWLSSHTETYTERVSQRGIARRLGMSQERVAKSLIKLEKLGVITADPAGPRGAWQITLDHEAWEGLGLIATRSVTDRHTIRSDRQTGTKESKEKSSSSERPRNPLWDSVVEACGLETNLTGSAASMVGKAVKELSQVGAEPEEVLLRAGRYRKRYRDCELTPPALIKHWSSLNGQNARPPKPVDYAEWNDDLNRWEYEF